MENKKKNRQKPDTHIHKVFFITALTPFIEIEGHGIMVFPYDQVPLSKYWLIGRKIYLDLTVQSTRVIGCPLGIPLFYSAEHTFTGSLWVYPRTVYRR